MSPYLLDKSDRNRLTISARIKQRENFLDKVYKIKLQILRMEIVISCRYYVSRCISVIKLFDFSILCKKKKKSFNTITCFNE